MIRYWICRCDCGNIKSVSQTHLRDGHTQSCGCVQQEKRHTNHKKYNEYKLSDDGKYYYIKIDDNKYTIIDKDDYFIVKKKYWRLKDGYAVNVLSNGKTIRLARYLLHIDNQENDLVVDHINRDRLDNRKENLRIVTQHENSFNASIGKNNKSGFIGVYRSRNKWVADIMYNNEKQVLGYFNDKRDAIKARLLGEIKYFGREFAPQRHLFNEFLNKDENE